MIAQPDIKKQLTDLANNQIALCLEQMDALHERWTSGKLDRGTYELKLKAWEDRWAESVKKLNELKR